MNDLEAKDLQIHAMTLLQEVNKLETTLSVFKLICDDKREKLEKFCLEFDQILKMIEGK